jgi:glutathione S-transferase
MEGHRMNTLTLVVGSKAYSSWSLRPWLILRHLGVPFDEIVIPLGRPDTRARILEHSPAGKVPVLRDGAISVWDSLAIAEYLAERFPAAGLWPEDTVARAHARTVSAEMHAGFPLIRTHLSCNFRATGRRAGTADGLTGEISRVDALWTDCRRRFGAGGDMLFGAFSIADAMYAPMVSRFRTYGVAVGETARAYMDAVWSLPAMQAWVRDAGPEPVIERFEIGR